MAKFERTEPRQDAGRVFDGGEIEDEDEEGSRLPLLLVIGLLVVAAFAGVVWLAYTQGVQRGRADAPRMLVAASGPVKEAPANPGGTATPFKGLKIYQQPAPSDDEDTDTSPQPAAAKPAPAVAPPKPAPAVAPVAAPPKPTKVAQTVAPEAGNPGDALATRPPRALHTMPSAQSSAQPVAAAAPTPKPLAIPAKAPKPVKTETAQAAVTAGGVGLQIGAYKSEADANAAWTSLSHKHPMVAAYRSAVKKVDLGDKGIWYRLRLGTFADKSAAEGFCDK